MNNQQGRNDQCSCGSGKKYKKCCLTISSPTSASSEVIDFSWKKLRQLEGTVVDKHLIPYVIKTLPDAVMSLAMEDCLPEDLPEEMDRERLFPQFLMPWIFFNWIPDEDFGLKNFDPEITLAENYLQSHKTKLRSDELRFIEAMISTFYSFYAILEVEKDQALHVKDILLGTEHHIKERQGTHCLKRGDIVFSRILTLDNQSIFVGMAPFILPPQHHIALLDFKKWLTEENDGKPLDGNALRNELDLDLYDYFFDAVIEVYNKPLPTLFNTDGELFQLTSSHFKLMQSPQNTLNRLMSMTLSDDPEEFLQDAKRTRTGKITQIQFRWLKKGNKKHKHWDNTVCGDVIINEGKLILKTNSVERAEKGKKLLAKLLGNSIEFQKTLIESLQHKMKSLSQTKKDQNSGDEDKPNPMDTPEIQEQITAMARAHWKTWFDESIPALANRTPREAAKTEEGREQLDALLLQYERMDEKRDKNDPFRADIGFIKKTLKLKK
ncbi:MAG: SEC-C metal-binding domain-containing protein [Gammaproteobacteria bacterium]